MSDFDEAAFREEMYRRLQAPRCNHARLQVNRDGRREISPCRRPATHDHDRVLNERVTIHHLYCGQCVDYDSLAKPLPREEKP